MPERIVGILGGMGPHATVDLYRQVLALTPAKKDQDHFPVLIFSNPRIPDRTQAILSGGRDPLPELIRSASILEQSGAGILAIPCNTAHYFLPELQERIGIPIINMIAEAAQDLRRIPGVRAAGLLAASGTVRSGIYQKILGQFGLDLIVPEAQDQERVHDCISQVKASVQDRHTQQTLEGVGQKLVAAGAQAVILGCTEIPLAFDAANVSYPCVNATHSLARAAVDWALGEKRLSSSANRSLFLDMGKVLLDFDFSEFGSRMSRLTGLDLDALRQAYMGDGLASRYEAGELDDRAFYELVCERMGVPVPWDEFVAAWTSIFRPVPILPEELLLAAARRADLWVISNTNSLHYRYVSEHFPLLRHFKGSVLSHEVGALKPDARIFQAALTRAGVKASQAVFVDDQLLNVQAAQALGIDAFQFVDRKQFEGELRAREILGLD